MKAGKPFNGCWLVALLLVAVIVAGGVVVWSGYHRSAVEISVASEQPFRGDIYIGGEVNSPGLYPLKEGDSLEDIIRAAGGPTDNANMNRLDLRIPALEATDTAQKIDLNRAEAWLLESLPGIGQDRAQAII